jgi:hypothetical protein
LAVLYRQLIELTTIDEARRAIRVLPDDEVRELLLMAIRGENLRHEDLARFIGSSEPTILDLGPPGHPQYWRAELPGCLRFSVACCLDDLIGVG